mmetsp:Transcript_34083/g.80435  ORF Transcript_34083/g.80435 Transcript_34083/m.80435 type:complete len:274 (+) Transcript_34083:108-929(+)
MRWTRLASTSLSLSPCISPSRPRPFRTAKREVGGAWRGACRTRTPPSGASPSHGPPGAAEARLGRGLCELGYARGDRAQGLARHGSLTIEGGGRATAALLGGLEVGELHQRRALAEDAHLHPLQLPVQQVELRAEALHLEAPPLLELPVLVLEAAAALLQLTHAHGQRLLQPAVPVLEQTHRALRVGDLLPEECDVLLARGLGGAAVLLQLEGGCLPPLVHRRPRLPVVDAQCLDGLLLLALRLEGVVLEGEEVLGVLVHQRLHTLHPGLRLL